MRIKLLATLVAVAALTAGCDQGGAGKDESPATDDLAGMSQAEGGETLALDTEAKKLSYIFGQNIGNQFKAETIDIDIDVFARGVEDALTGAEPKLAEDEIMAALQSFQETKMAEQKKAFDEMSAKNKTEGEAFLAENSTKEGVVTTESGLQYKIVNEGDGASPAEESTVKVHYKGTLIDGSVFDSSYDRGAPATFGVNQVIPGWTEALPMMKEGGKWELYIPPSLAYGPGGAGSMIGPEQTLIFEVELLDASVEEGEDAAAEESGDKEPAAGGGE